MNKTVRIVTGMIFIGLFLFFGMLIMGIVFSCLGRHIEAVEVLLWAIIIDTGVTALLNVKSSLIEEEKEKLFESSENYSDPVNVNLEKDQLIDKQKGELWDYKRMTTMIILGLEFDLGEIKRLYPTENAVIQSMEERIIRLKKVIER